MPNTFPDSVTDLLIPLLRAYIRYVPFGAGKRLVWTRVVDPGFAWHSHPFVASTVLGRKIDGNTNDIIQQYIYYFGVWEPHLTRWIGRRLAPGDMFIAAAPLDHILLPEEMQKARFIKIDVEGAEWSAVAGMGALLSESVGEPGGQR